MIAFRPLVQYASSGIIAPVTLPMAPYSVAKQKFEARKFVVCEYFFPSANQLLEKILLVNQVETNKRDLKSMGSWFAWSAFSTH